MKRENFGDRSIVDRVVGTGVAAHEGQLFGLFNQLLGLFTAIGLLLLSVSAVILWWRRAVGVISLIFVLLNERFVLRNIPAARQWLGLSAA